MDTTTVPVQVAQVAGSQVTGNGQISEIQGQEGG